MKLADIPYDQKLEDINTAEFTALASKLEAFVSLTPNEYDYAVFVLSLLSPVFIVNVFNIVFTLTLLLSLRIS